MNIVGRNVTMRFVRDENGAVALRFEGADDTDSTQSTTRYTVDLPAVVVTNEDSL